MGPRAVPCSQRLRLRNTYVNPDDLRPGGAVAGRPTFLPLDTSHFRVHPILFGSRVGLRSRGRFPPPPAAPGCFLIMILLLIVICWSAALDQDREGEHPQIGALSHTQNSALPGVRAKGITSRMLLTPVRNMSNRSKPNPNPACGTVPYRRRSVYHQ